MTSDTKLTVDTDKILYASARLLHVLGDPNRLAILELLLENARSVSELVDALGAPQSRVSNHLACLRWCRLVEAEKNGRQQIYRIVDPDIAKILALVRRFANAHCDHLATCKRIGPDWI